MVGLTALWLPILLSAVLVFIASSVIHMALGYHKNDYRKLPDEEKVRAALRGMNIPPGDYALPHATSSKDMQSPEMQQKYSEGPVALITVYPSGPPAMGKNLVQWFVFSVVVSLLAAYLAGRTLTAGAEYLAVFRITGTTAFLGYGLAQAVESIWKGRAWGQTARNMVDALIYGLFTAGVFGWLWPTM